MTNTKANRAKRAMTLGLAAAVLLLAGVALALPPGSGDSHASIRGGDAPRSFAGAASDAWITTKVKTRLIFEPGIAPLSMNVDTRNGVVTLFGSISTEDGKRAAGVESMKVAGVHELRNELQVVAKTDESAVERRDGRIRETVQQRLSERPALHDDDIDVEVANGVVRLSGSVAQSGDRMIALSLARATEGVRSVLDGLRVEQQG